MLDTCNETSAIYNPVLAIILNWNKPEETLSCVDSFYKDEGTFDILVVDNGSLPDLKNKLVNSLSSKYQSRIITPDDHVAQDLYQKNVYIMLLNKNTGYAQGNNFGILFAINSGYEFSLISNNDIELIEKNTISTLLSHIRTNKDIAWAAPEIINRNGRSEGPFPKTSISELFLKKGIFLPLWLIFFRTQEHRIEKNLRNAYTSGKLTPYIFGGSFGLFRNSAMQQVGFFDEKTFLYSEEQIISERLSRKGYSKKYVPSVQVIHNHEYDNDGLDLKKELIFLKSRRYYYREYRGHSKILINIASLSRIFWLIFYKPAIVFFKQLRKRLLNPTAL
jgi:GT2 family glycosyltransferase